MSVDISLRNAETGEVLSVVEGGGYGTVVTVSPAFMDVFPFYKLNGLTAQAALPMLLDAVKRLGTERDPDYRKPTPGNVGHACLVLAEWAERFPEGFFDVT